MTENTRQIMVGDVAVGGGAPVSVQSMTNTDTRNVAATLEQIRQLTAAGCEIVRCAVPDATAAEALRAIKAECPIPLIADIHFDHKLALASVAAGVDALRINPGNIGETWKVREIVAACADRGIPIRIGVNAGSLEKKVLEAYGHPCAEALVVSAIGNIRILEDLNFDQIKVSIKASDVQRTIVAYRMLAGKVDYPLHIGVTEAGTIWSGTIKSAIGIGALLAEGIGDTLRVSLTGDPVEEIRVGWEILKSLELRERGPVFISCPTCGRCEIDLIDVAEEVERRLHGLPKKISVAVMGCVVNGPGEAREADLGLAGGRGEGVIFRKGKLVRKVPETEMVEALLEEARKMIEEKS
ncbi:MAG: 4-hydroxy-3-methylbut-2-en-1-yl diphosphate synthase [Desulfuromonas sp.]|nr:MAG: 4-hydroxy-3-methylbut-2-en-1-yl diphosphate synthase [Desulfuromonas sp.]